MAIIERQSFPRDRPGETLHPGIERPLAQLGVLRAVNRAGFLRHAGIWVQWDQPVRLVHYGSDEAGPWLGFQAWRPTFDQLLLERCLKLGVDFHERCRALHPALAGDRVVGVETSEGTLKGDFVVDAAGPRHWLARRLGLPVGYHSPPLNASFGYARGLCLAREETPAIMADETGWTWTAKIRADLYHWTRLNLDGSVPERDFVPEQFRGLSRRGRSRSAEVSWRAVRDSAGPGYFLVGDAATVLDPAASHGVLKAVLSGMHAGRLIVEMLITGGDAQATAASYRDWLASWFAHDVDALRALYQRLENPPAWLNSTASRSPSYVRASPSSQLSIS